MDAKNKYWVCIIGPCSFLANAAAVKAMGWDNAIGKKVKFYQAKEDAQVIGVVKDFHFASLHSAIEPALICKIPQEHGFLQVRVTGNVSEAIHAIQSQWNVYDSSYPFEITFLTSDLMTSTSQTQHKSSC